MTALSTQTRTSIIENASSTASLRAQIQLIQHAMTEVMIEGTHYGRIPGAAKPSLWKSGAEVLCLLFRVAPLFVTEDLSTADCIRYRVRCIGRHQTTGIDLGEGVGECSTDESKYRWRAPICDEEFVATPVDRRREKWMRGSNGTYVQKQIRTEIADLANTVLKMSSKRALVSMVLHCLAASDCFSQDLEDLPEGVVVDGDRKPPHRATRRPQSQSQSRPRSSGGQGFATEAQIKLLRVKLNDAGMSAEDVCRRFGIDSITKLPFESMNEALAFIADPERAAIRAASSDAENG